MTNTNSIDRAAIENLRSFALAQVSGFTPRECADRPHFAAFAHMCTAALNGEEWALERIDEVLEEIYGGDVPAIDSARLHIIRSTDTTRPDGAIARGALVL